MDQVSRVAAACQAGVGKHSATRDPMKMADVTALQAENQALRQEVACPREQMAPSNRSWQAPSPGIAELDHRSQDPPAFVKAKNAGMGTQHARRSTPTILARILTTSNTRKLSCRTINSLTTPVYER